jgi:hypothetical protein
LVAAADDRHFGDYLGADGVRRVLPAAAVQRLVHERPVGGEAGGRGIELGLGRKLDHAAVLVANVHPASRSMSPGEAHVTLLPVAAGCHT